VLVVGAGLAGLSAAWQAAELGANVEVVDMASVFGGHAVMSAADITIIDTPLQRAQGIRDTPDLAYEDFIRWGEDNDREWVRYYVDHSRIEIHDWLTSLGVTFQGLRPYPGNRVPRAHETQGLGLGLVGPVYRACLSHANITFAWNERVTELILENGRVAGVRLESTRTGQTRTDHAGAVILATGGFQSNLARVRQNWPPGTPVPERLLAGSGINSTGSGLDLASRAGAQLVHLDHQWNYQRGLPDPRYPGGDRGVNAGVTGSIWVNAQGNRFVNEAGSSIEALHGLLQQRPATYWAVFDARSRDSVWVVGTGWDHDSLQRWILDNPQLLKRADSVADLAAQMGVPAQALLATVSRYNAMAAKGEDEEFGRFGQHNAAAGAPPTIESPPFYALQFFPLTRKSMGGVAIDRRTRALDRANHPIAGLYAAGEVAGLAGINGKAALEGTFLGPSVITGRMAARTAVAELRKGVQRTHTRESAAAPAPSNTPGVNCATCHDLPRLVEAQRPGYWHFERAHRLVLERKLECATCHAGMPGPAERARHQIDRRAQSETCALCHHSE
jgi:flavocytochrome c